MSGQTQVLSTDLHPYFNRLNLSNVIAGRKVASIFDGIKWLFSQVLAIILQKFKTAVIRVLQVHCRNLAFTVASIYGSPSCIYIYKYNLSITLVPVRSGGALKES